MRYAFLFLTVLVTAGLAQQALTPPQAKALYEKADRALNDAWAVARKVLPESDYNVLKESQRAWVAHRDYLARSPMFAGAEGAEELSLDAPEYLEAAAGLTDMRTSWLKGLVKDSGEDSLTGVWTDSYGGRIEIVEREGHLHFVMQCVRGPTSHIGGLAGVAAWNQTIGWFSDKGHADGKDDETNLSFVLRAKKLEVIGANTGYYHGARAYFDGDYVRVEALSAKQQAKIVNAAKTGELPEE